MSFDSIIAPSTHDTEPVQDRFLTFAQVLAVTGLSRSLLYEQIAAGDFPGPYILSRRRRGWKLSEITAWINSRERTGRK